MEYTTNKMHKSLIFITILICFLFLGTVIIIQNNNLNQLKKLISRNQNYIDKVEKQNRELQSELLMLEDKTKYNSSATKCNKKVDVWSALPKEIQIKTYKEDVISAGQATYELTLLKWSANCKYLPFILDLVGRGSEAYEDQDFKPRGLYIFDDNLKEIKTIKLVDKDSFIDYLEYDSNYWFVEKYVFVVSTDVRNNQFIKNRYVYDSYLSLLMPYGQ